MGRTRSAVVREVLAHEDPRAHGKRLADQHRLDFGLVWSWVLDEARRLATEQLPAAGFLERLLDDGERARILALATADRTCTMSGRLDQLLRTCAATPEQIQRLFSQLPADGSQDGELDAILENPSTPERLLFELLDQGRCIAVLGHRGGPQRLLERLAEEHGYEEAITTLALSYYGPPPCPLATFVAFVERHRACWMLDHNLRRADHLPEERRRAALEILDRVRGA